MEQRNQTCVSEFILLGLSEEAELQPLVFCLFLSMYLVIFIENSLIILAITDSHLYIPMYLFLSNLSFSDICFTSTIIPKMLLNIQTQSKVITYEGCITQMYFYMLFGGLDNFLLTEMAYDRFVAICYPLHYMVVMNSKLCGILGCLSNYKKDRTMKVYCCSCQRKAAASWMICFRKKIICHITDCISSVKIYANYSRKRLHVELESTSN